MSRTLAEWPSGPRLTDHISLGVVAKVVPRQAVDAVLEETGRQSRRQRQLPARVMVYYAIALAFYMEASAREVLRSKTPELVRQELYGLLLAHFAVRCLMHEAALKGDRDPDDLSFLHAVRVIERKIPHYPAIPPSAPKSLS